MEFYSPGKLPKTQTFDGMKQGRSKIRNEALAKAFSYMKLMEKWGSGIPRVVQEVCDDGLTVPEFSGGEVDLVVNIYRKNPMTASATKNATDATKNATDATKNATNATDATKNESYMTDFTENEILIIEAIKKNPNITQQGLHNETKVKIGTIKRILPDLQKKGILLREGSRRSGEWKVIK